MDTQALANELFKQSSEEFEFSIDIELNGISVELMFELDQDDYSFKLIQIGDKRCIIIQKT
jgi:hypothetical protein